MICFASKLILLDFETTDPNEDEIEIIEVGALKIDTDLTVLDEFTRLVRPKNVNNITEYITDITGFVQSDFDNEREWLHIWKEFAEFTEYNKIALASWGTYVDISMLRNTYRQNRLGYPHKQFPIDIGSVVWGFASAYGLNINSYRMRSVAKAFEMEVSEKHRALYDCKIMHGILSYLQNLM